MEKIKVVVCVSGGNIQSIHTSDPLNVDFQIVDFDNLQAEGKTDEQQEEIFANAVVGLFNQKG